MKIRDFRVVAVLLLFVAMPASAQLLGTAFTYQGYLEDGGEPKNGAIDLAINAFDAQSGGELVGVVRLESVSVSNGVFTVSLDFGGGTFLGTPVFLEIHVREDADGDLASNDNFVMLSPRQALTPTPYALHAESVSLDAIGSAQIANGGVGTGDLANRAVTNAKLADEAVTSNKLADGSVGSRHLASNAVIAGKIASNSITGAQVQDGSLTAADVDTTSNTSGLQRRVSGTCPFGELLFRIRDDGSVECKPLENSVSLFALQDRVTGECRGASAIRQINNDGSVACAYLDSPTPAAPVTMEATGDVGSHLSLLRSATGSRASIVVAYYDATLNRLKLARCNSDCSGGTTRLTLDAGPADVGQYASVESIAGRLGVAYYDATNRDLRLALCDNGDCSGSVQLRTIDSVGDVGRFAEIMSVGNRVGVAYYDANNNGYKFALCDDSDCTTSTITPLSGLSGGGVLASDIAAARVGSLSLPRFAVIAQGTDVVMVNCETITCSSFTTRVVSEAGIPVGPPLAMTSIGSGSAAQHWVAYNRPGFAGPTIRLCENADCEGQIRNVSNTAVGGMVGLALAPAANRLPIQVAAQASGVLRFNAFTAPTESRHNALNGTSANGGAIDITGVGVADGDGVGIVYYDASNGDLKYQHCQRDDCSEL